jgi:hypothetical protein
VEEEPLLSMGKKASRRGEARLLPARKAATGYSPAPLVKKLGLKPGAKGLFVAAPDDYGKTLGPLPEGFSLREISLTQAEGKALQKAAPAQGFDFIQCFCRMEAELAAIFAPLKGVLAQSGMLWISWPKLAKQTQRIQAKVDRFPAAGQTEPALKENQVRSLGLGAGLVDVKVCAVDETWSGLKFVFRLKDRTK